MPTEELGKGKLYYKSKDDKEYKELGTGEVEFSSIEEGKNSEFNEMEEIYNETGFTAELEIKLKKYSKKRFKKLLMAQGIQRNDAEIFASIAGDKKSWIHRNDFGLMITTSIVTAWRYGNTKRKKVEK